MLTIAASVIHLTTLLHTTIHSELKQAWILFFSKSLLLRVEKVLQSQILLRYGK